MAFPKARGGNFDKIAVCSEFGYGFTAAVTHAFAQA
jgi:hypothetical protein